MWIRNLNQQISGNIVYMKQWLLQIGFTLVLALVFIPGVVDAQASGVSFPNPIGKNNINEILTAVLDFLTAIGAVLAVLFTVYAGFLFVTARGDEGAITKAKQTLFWTLVGALVVLGAYALAGVIENTADQLKR
jgi:type II secretory pathway component PulF